MCGILKIKPEKFNHKRIYYNRTLGREVTNASNKVNGFIHLSKRNNAIHFNYFIVANFTTFYQKSLSFSLRRKFEEKPKIFKIFTHPIKNAINRGKLLKKSKKPFKSIRV